MAKTFTPGPKTSREFRDALGCFATGVTVVTAQTDTGPIGMTANSFTSISLNPPLVMWSPAKTSIRYPYFAAAEFFAIHILAEGQRDTALAFARRGDAFDTVDWEAHATGVPMLTSALTSFLCRTSAIHDGGDHVIVVAEVTETTQREGTPLVFARGGYGRFALDA